MLWLWFILESEKAQFLSGNAVSDILMFEKKGDVLCESFSNWLFLQLAVQPVNSDWLGWHVQHFGAERGNYC